MDLVPEGAKISMGLGKISMKGGKMSMGSRKGIETRWEEMSMGYGRDHPIVLVAVLEVLPSWIAVGAPETGRRKVCPIER